MMRLEVEQLSNVSVVRAREDIDAANARRVRDELAACMGGPAEHLVLDLSATRYLDSAGIDMLFRLNERLRERRARLQLVMMSFGTRRVRSSPRTTSPRRMPSRGRLKLKRG